MGGNIWMVFHPLDTLGGEIDMEGERIEEYQKRMGCKVYRTGRNCGSCGFSLLPSEQHTCSECVKSDK